MLEGLGLSAGHPAAHGEAPQPTGPLDLALSRGEWIGLVGGNGSGKTAVLLTLAGLLPPRGGSVRIDGEALEDLRPRSRIGVVFQEPESQFVCESVARELAFPLENLGWERDRIVARVRELIDSFELSSFAGAPPLRLSGGEMQRVALAAAVAAEPHYLLLDEPGSHLDPPARAQVLAFTRRLARERGVGVLWSACDVGECEGADRIVRLSGSNADCPVRPGPGARPVSDAARHGAPRSGTAPLWRARGIALSLRDPRGGVRLWGGLDFEIAPGEWISVEGRNGSGKTLLLEALIGWRRPSEGTLSRPPEGSVRLGYLPQFPEHQLFAATVREDVAFGIRHGSRSDSHQHIALPSPEDRTDTALAAAGFDPEQVAGRAPDALSLGERRRVALAGLLATEPIAALLDEPFAGLDPGAARNLGSILAGLWDRGVALVIASHDPFATRFRNGRRIPLGVPVRFAPGPVRTLSRTP